MIPKIRVSINGQQVDIIPHIMYLTTKLRACKHKTHMYDEVLNSTHSQEETLKAQIRTKVGHPNRIGIIYCTSCCEEPKNKLCHKMIGVEDMSSPLFWIINFKKMHIFTKKTKKFVFLYLYQYTKVYKEDGKVMLNSYYFRS